MKANEAIQLVLYFGLLIGLTPVMGGFMARVFAGERTFLQPMLKPIERWIYRLGGVRADEEMSWKRYFAAVLIFNVIGIITLMALEMAQGWLPLNPPTFSRLAVGTGVKHGHQFHHQHKLAGVLGRKHHELPHADGRVGGA